MQWEVLLVIFGLAYVRNAASIEIESYEGGGNVEPKTSGIFFRQLRSPILNQGSSQNYGKNTRSELLSRLLLEWLKKKGNDGNNQGSGTVTAQPVLKPSNCSIPEIPGHHGHDGNGHHGGGNHGNSGGGGHSDTHNLFKNLRYLCFHFDKDGEYEVDAEFYKPQRSQKHSGYNCYDPYSGCVYPSQYKGQTANDDYYSPYNYWQPYQGTGGYNVYSQKASSAVGSGSSVNAAKVTPIVVGAEPSSYFGTQKNTLLRKAY